MAFLGLIQRLSLGLFGEAPTAGLLIAAKHERNAGCVCD